MIDWKVRSKGEGAVSKLCRASFVGSVELQSEIGEWSHSSELANSPCLRQEAEAISANGIQNDAEEAVYAVEAAWRRRKELQGAAGGKPLQTIIEHLMVNKLNKQTNKQTKTKQNNSSFRSQQLYKS